MTFTSFSDLAGCLCSEYVHLRLAGMPETVSGVKSVSSFLYLVTQYFTARFMRCGITSIAKCFLFQQLSAALSTDWLLFLSQGRLHFTGILCLFPSF